MIDDKFLWTDERCDIASQLAAWRALHPKMGLLVLAAEASASRIERLQKICHETGIPLLGAIFPELICDQAFCRSGLWLLRMNVMPPFFLCADMDSDSNTAVQRMAEQVTTPLARRSDKPTLFLVFDGMLPNIGSLLASLFSELGHSVRYTGVNAGSETFKPLPCLFDSTRILGNAVFGMLLPGTTHSAVKHHYPVTKRLLSASSSEGNRIDRIDGKPAFEVYQNVIQAEFGISVTRENFYEYAVHFPFGLVTLVDVLVRIPVALNADGSLYCIGEVPAHSKLWLLRAPSLDSSDCVVALCAALATPNTILADKPLLTFYCAGRRMHFGDESSLEIGRLKKLTGSSGLCGALSLGEIDSMEELNFPRFHNASIVCMY